ncbi:MAG: hypothetical protein IT453_07780 [Planctomycetes bacterium]|nr:hypothetical protein [Planctomycetota bacterium]
MQLDDFQSLWAAHGAALARSVAIDERVLRELLLGKARRALVAQAAGLACEVAFGAAALALTVPVVAAHADEPRYALVGGALIAFVAALTVHGASLAVRAARLDYGGSVARMQREVESLRLSAYRAVKWALLGGVALWLPAVLVAFEAWTGVDALARVDLAWLGANVVFGLAALAAGHAWSKRHVERAERSPWAARWLDALSGRGVRRASQQLDELARFVREPSPAD